MINLLVTLAISVALPPDPVTGFAQAIVVPADSALIHTTQVFSEATGDIFTQTSAALNRLAPMTGGLDRVVRLHGIVDPKVDQYIGLKPDAVFLLTDGQFDSPTPAKIKEWNTGHVPIHVIDLGPGKPVEILEQIARDSSGVYRKRP